MSINKYLSLIEKSYSSNHANKFSNDYVTTNHTNLLLKCCSDILQMIPPKPFACALLSATLVEFARQQNIHCYLVAGSLDFKNKRLFTYDPVIEQENMVDNWSGHCWVVFNDAIAEISLFRTAYSKQSPKWLYDMISNEFGENRGALVTSIAEQEKMGFSYTPEYIINDLQISGLLNAVEQLISATCNISIDSTTSRIVCPVPGFLHDETLFL